MDKSSRIWETARVRLERRRVKYSSARTEAEEESDDNIG